MPHLLGGAFEARAIVLEAAALWADTVNQAMPANGPALGGGPARCMSRRPPRSITPAASALASGEEFLLPSPGKSLTRNDVGRRRRFHACRRSSSNWRPSSTAHAGTNRVLRSSTVHSKASPRFTFFFARGNAHWLDWKGLSNLARETDGRTHGGAAGPLGRAYRGA